ncbi:hypothetical protein PFLUV_G00128410 [Perca fluviatilis]|uniref:Uncharacterized protein n=1 Tax=Perca fluviatilis TaxID=8168 RepID=A0A6A5EXR9_PERFL|nr:hypothetical protein PFLUV_G00128410 [Perca fluviatilis]
MCLLALPGCVFLRCQDVSSCVARMCLLALPGCIFSGSQGASSCILALRLPEEVALPSLSVSITTPSLSFFCLFLYSPLPLSSSSSSSTWMLPSDLSPVDFLSYNMIRCTIQASFCVAFLDWLIPTPCKNISKCLLQMRNNAENLTRSKLLPFLRGMKLSEAMCKRDCCIYFFIVQKFRTQFARTFMVYHRCHQ